MAKQIWDKLSSSTKILLTASFLIPFGSFMIVPFIPIFLNEKIGLSMPHVGWVLAIASLIQFGGGLIGGMIADYFGYKRTMVMALLVRTVGFIMLLVSLKFTALAVLAIMTIATGAALYLPANKAYLVSHVSQEEKALYLSLSNSALNAGMGLGPLVGGLAIMGYENLLFSLTIMIFVLMTILHLKIKNINLTTNKPKIAHYFNLNSIKTIKIPLIFSFLTFYLYFFFQNYLGPYIIISRPAVIFSLALIFNSLIVIVFQPLLSKLIDKLDFYAVMFIGFFSLFAGMTAIAHFGTIGIFIGVLFIALSEVFLFFKLELKIVSLSPNSLATSLGMHRLFLGLGASVSGVVGGSLFDVFQPLNKHLFWGFVSYQVLPVLVVCFVLFKCVKNRVHF